MLLRHDIRAHGKIYTEKRQPQLAAVIEMEGLQNTDSQKPPCHERRPDILLQRGKWGILTERPGCQRGGAGFRIGQETVSERQRMRGDLLGAWRYGKQLL